MAALSTGGLVIVGAATVGVVLYDAYLTFDTLSIYATGVGIDVNLHHIGGMLSPAPAFPQNQTPQQCGSGAPPSNGQTTGGYNGSGINPGGGHAPG
jgi:phage baseplate assembly protein gpV